MDLSPDPVVLVLDEERLPGLLVLLALANYPRNGVCGASRDRRQHGLDGRERPHGTRPHGVRYTALDQRGHEHVHGRTQAVRALHRRHRRRHPELGFALFTDHREIRRLTVRVPVPSRVMRLGRGRERVEHADLVRSDPHVAYQGPGEPPDLALPRGSHEPEHAVLLPTGASGALLARDRPERLQHPPHGERLGLGQRHLPSLQRDGDVAQVPELVVHARHRLFGRPRRLRDRRAHRRAAHHELAAHLVPLRAPAEREVHRR